MTTPVSPLPETLLVLAVGEFGEAVARALQRLVSVTVILHAVTERRLPVLLEDPTLAVVLTAGSLLPELADQLDARSFATNTSFLSLLMVNQTLLFGPVIRPGLSACWRCWAARDMQADAAPYASQRRRFYADHPAQTPRGFLPSLARFGAAQLAEASASLKTSGDNAGLVVRTDLFGRRIVVSRAVGLDDCSRCGLRRDLASRSYEGLRCSLASLWSGHPQENL